MAEDECWNRFADADVRIAAQVVTGRETTPVSHVVEDGSLVFCAASGNGSGGFLAHSLMSVHIDGYNAREAFTVTMIGYTEDITPRSETLRFDGLELQPSTPADRRWVAFVPISVEGRIFAVDAESSDPHSPPAARGRFDSRVIGTHTISTGAAGVISA